MAYRIIPRSEWGARRTPGPRKRLLPAKRAYLHHSGGAGHWLPPTATFAQECAVVRAIEEIGHQRFGAYGYGISYTGLVFPSGRIYEGHPIEYLGAHTSGHNTEGVGVNWPGDYTRTSGTPQQIAATKWLLEEWHRRGHLLVTTFNGGHRDVFPTACPGDTAYAQIPVINRADPAPIAPKPDPAFRKAQTLLAELGYDIGPDDADGFPGPNTDAGIAAYANDYGYTGKTIAALITHLEDSMSQLDRIEAKIDAIPGKVWLFKLRDPATGTMLHASTFIRHLRSGVQDVTATARGLVEGIASLATGGVDHEEILRRVDERTDQQLADLRVTRASDDTDPEKEAV